MRPETDPKKEETDPIKDKTDQQTEDLKLFWKPKTDPKKRGNVPKKKGNKSNVNIAEIDPKYLEIPKTFQFLRDFW